MKLAESGIYYRYKCPWRVQNIFFQIENSLSIGVLIAISGDNGPNIKGISCGKSWQIWMSKNWTIPRTTSPFHPAGTSGSYNRFEISGNSDPIIIYGRSVSKSLLRPFLHENPWISHAPQDSFKKPLYRLNIQKTSVQVE